MSYHALLLSHLTARPEAQRNGLRVFLTPQSPHPQLSARKQEPKPSPQAL